MDNVKKENGTCGCGRSPTGDCIGWHDVNARSSMRQKLMLTKRRCLKKVKIKVFSHAAPIQGAAIQNKGEK